MYSIGEFAKLSNVTTQTLRHYDAIGLLKPCKIHSKNQYRMYTIGQLDQMHTIRLLKLSGYKLSDIKVFLESYDPHEMLEMLENKMLDLQIEMEQLQLMQRNIQRKVDILKFGLSDEEETSFYYKELPDRYIYLEAVNTQEITEQFTATLNRMLKNQDDVSPYLSQVGLILDQSHFLKKLFGHYKGIFVFSDEASKKTLHLEAGKYVCIKHKGGYDSIHETYNKLLEHIKKEKMCVLGPLIDYGIVDHFITNDENRYVTEIQIRIKINP